ncbi:MAG TPA: hypothetical protein VGM19_12370 [Armatimonadota bacterium]|jgi:hypothetical protein
MADSLRTYRKSSRSRRLTGLYILLAALAGGVLVGTLSYLYGPSYHTAMVSLLVPGTPSAESGPAPAPAAAATGAEAASAPPAAPPPGLQKYLLILRSRSLQDKLIQQFNLQEVLHLDPGYTRMELAGMIKYELADDLGLTITVTTRGARRPLPGLSMTSLQREQAQQLCADLANASAAYLRDYVKTTDTEQAGKEQQFLQVNLAQVRTRLRDTEDRLEKLQSTHGLLDPQEKGTQALARLKTIQDASDATRVRQDELSRSLAAARGQLRETDRMSLASRVQSRNPVISDLESKRAQLKIELATQQAMGKTSQQRDVAQTQASLSSIEAQLSSVQEQVLKEVATQANPAYAALLSSAVAQEVELAGVRARAGEYRRLQAAATSQIQSLPPVARQYASLRRDQEVLSQLATNLSRQLELATIQARGASRDPFVTLDAAVPPDLPVGPRSVESGLIAFVLILGLTWLIISVRRGLFDVFRL